MSLYQSYDAIIEDREGYPFSVWFAYADQKIWYVEFTDGSPLKLVRKDFQDVHVLTEVI